MSITVASIIVICRFNLPTMNKYRPTPKQEAAFKKVVDAMKAAKKLGLTFYGRSDVLVAYNQQAEEYKAKYPGWALIGNGNDHIPHLSDIKVLTDSGADDYECYKHESDDPDLIDEDDDE